MDELKPSDVRVISRRAMCCYALCAVSTCGVKRGTTCAVSEYQARHRRQEKGPAEAGPLVVEL